MDVHLAAGQAVEQLVGVLLDFGQHRLNEQRLDAIATASLFQLAQQTDVDGQTLLLLAQPSAGLALVAQHVHLLAGGAGDTNGGGMVIAQAGQLRFGRTQVGRPGLQVAQRCGQLLVLRLQVGHTGHRPLALAAQVLQRVGQRFHGRLGAAELLILLRRGGPLLPLLAGRVVGGGLVGHARQTRIHRRQGRARFRRIGLFDQSAARRLQFQPAAAGPRLFDAIQFLAARFQAADLTRQYLLVARHLARLLGGRLETLYLGLQGRQVSRAGQQAG